MAPTLAPVKKTERSDQASDEFDLDVRLPFGEIDVANTPRMFTDGSCWTESGGACGTYTFGCGSGGSGGSRCICVE